MEVKQARAGNERLRPAQVTVLTSSFLRRCWLWNTHSSRGTSRWIERLQLSFQRSRIDDNCDEQRLQKLRVDRWWTALDTESVPSALHCVYLNGILEIVGMAGSDAAAAMHWPSHMLSRRQTFIPIDEVARSRIVLLYVRGILCFENFLLAQASKHLRSNLMADTVNPYLA